MRRCRPVVFLALMAAVLPAGALRAQTAESPQALARLVLSRFASGSAAAFDSVYADPSGRDLVRWSIEYGWKRRPVAAEVVRVGADRAVLRLAGYPVRGHSGYETSLGQLFTGLYEAERTDAGWRLGRRLATDAGNRILAQALHVRLRPGQGLEVRDTLTIRVGDASGFWAVLNHTAVLREVRVNGRPAEHRFDAGLLWVGAPRRPATSTLVLDYVLDVGRDSAANPNFARFAPEFGHARNQHYWHPFFGFASDSAEADVRLVVRAPAAYRVVTGLEQRDSVAGAERVVLARSVRPVTSVTLLYDRDWKRSSLRLGTMHAELFLTDSIEPSRAEIESTLVFVHRTLSARFGEPRATYFAAVQGRGTGGYGWQFRSNDMIVSSPRGGRLFEGLPWPSANFGHEVAHAWTNPTGAGRNFLMEGWAMFAEALLLEARYGPEAAELLWQKLRSDYLRSGDEGSATLLGDGHNSGVSYTKGGWVLRMLRDEIGAAAFERGMRDYIALPAGRPAGVTEFAAAMSRAAGRDVAPFLEPWLAERTIPDVEARLEPGRVVLAQRGPVFRLSLDVELETAAGPVRRRVALARAVDTLDLHGLAEVRGVRLDPDHRLLMHRRLGERVRFELAAPEAKEVTLRASFAGGALPARRDGERWVVEVPLLEGVYGYFWRVDGKIRHEADGGRCVVRPLEALDSPYPR